MLTPIQSRMARAALGWSMRDLARHAGVSVSTVSRFEATPTDPIDATHRSMRKALEKAGIELIDHNAVRFRGDWKPSRLY